MAIGSDTDDRLHRQLDDEDEREPIVSGGDTHIITYCERVDPVEARCGISLQ